MKSWAEADGVISTQGYRSKLVLFGFKKIIEVIAIGILNNSESVMNIQCELFFFNYVGDG